jgi:phosphatidylglycerol:prolipoprotein diacylglycerol transferase
MLSLGPLEIRWYSLAYIIGFLFSWIYIKKLSLNKSLYDRKSNFDLKLVDDLVFYSVIGLIIGARFGYIIFYNLEFYLQNPLNVFYVWEGGLSFHGGLIGIIIAALYTSRIYKTKFLELTDLICVSAPVGIFLGRISNFINGELYGRPSSTLFGIIFPTADNQYRHPSQLYEAFLEGILLFIILNISIFFFKTLSRPGYISGLFLLFYGLFRFLVEFSREPDIQVGFIYTFLTMGMILSVPMIIAGIIIMIISSKK